MNNYSIVARGAGASQRQQFIQTLAKRFQGNQDNAHNAIIKYLLDTDYSSAKLAQRGVPARHIAAYEVLRGPEVNTIKPLYWVRDAAQLAQVRHSNFFIRDYMQLQTRGGTNSNPMVFRDQHIIDGVLYSRFVQDFNRLVQEVNLQDTVLMTGHLVREFAGVAHRDAIQLIPYPAEVQYRISQFAEDIMQHVTLQNNRIFSRANLQGIFASDGAFRYLKVLDNHVTVAGAHTITLHGVLSAQISGNRNEQGALLPADKIKLRPLRIGGGAGVFILGFNNAGRLSTHPDYYAYEPVTGQAVQDLRRVPYLGGSNWTHVDMVALRQRFPIVFRQVKAIYRNPDIADKEVKIRQVWETMMSQVGRKAL